MNRPKTQYAAIDDSYIAYQVFGDGPDVCLQIGWFIAIEALWDHRGTSAFLERLASFSRVILFDRRGHGMSDPVDLDNITVEEWVRDLTAVMDAVDSRGATLIGGNEASPMLILHASTHPERTDGLVLVNATASFARRPDYPFGMPERVQERAIEMMKDLILHGDSADVAAAVAPGSSTDIGRSFGRDLRFATSPGMLEKLMRVSVATDARHLLPLVHVPTLVLHSKGQTFIRADHGRYLAEHIPSARFVELPGDDLLPWGGDRDVILDEIEEFVTGTRSVRESDRVLATVLFTDIVSSTERASAVGDRRWLEQLDEHNRIVRRELDRSKGREIHTAGDGFLATFDGPARAVRCAQSIVGALRKRDISVRAGLHTGEIELRGDDIGGIAVHIGKRVSEAAATSEVLVSRTVVDLVAGSGLTFDDRGTHVLKGVPGEFQLYAVNSVASTA